jgi:hypothetical protein
VLLHRKIHGLGEALQKYFLHHHHLVIVLLEFPVDPLLPLPRWNKGTSHHQAARVTEYESAAHLQRSSS